MVLAKVTTKHFMKLPKKSKRARELNSNRRLTQSRIGPFELLLFILLLFMEIVKHQSVSERASCILNNKLMKISA